jgi:hypothetical protein
MNNNQIDSFAVNKAKIIAEIEQGANYLLLSMKWPGLSQGMYDMCAGEAIGNLNRRLYPHNHQIKNMRDVKLLQAMVEIGTFDLSKALIGGFTKEDAEAVLASSGFAFSDAGYRELGEPILTTVTDEMLAQINICVHFIQSWFLRSKSWYGSGNSYNLKHSVERFTRIAHELDDSQPSFYIANVSFILAAMLCGIQVRRKEDTLNAEFRMKSKGARLLRFATGEH